MGLRKGCERMKTLYKRLCQAEFLISALCLIASVILIFTQALFRLADHPINWGMYIALFLFTWSTFLGADIAYRNNNTVYVDIFINKMPKKLQGALRLVCQLLSLAFMIAMIYFGVLLCIKSKARPYQALQGFSYSWVALSVPVSFSLMVITCLRKMYYEWVLHEEPPVVDIVRFKSKKKGGGAK